MLVAQGLRGRAEGGGRTRAGRRDPRRGSAGVVRHGRSVAIPVGSPPPATPPGAGDQQVLEPVRLPGARAAAVLISGGRQSLLLFVFVATGPAGTGSRDRQQRDCPASGRAEAWARERRRPAAGE
jgi:hypothetical protein